MNIEPGLQEELYLAGTLFAVAPDGYKPQWSPVELDELLADTSTLTERPYQPFIGAPDRLRKLFVDLSWSKITNVGDLQTLEDLDALAWPFDFTDWRPIAERFSGDGSNKAFTLCRRSALLSIAGGSLPPTASTRYATEVYVDGSLDASYSTGTADALGRLPLTTAATPASGLGNVLVRYVPLYLVREIGSDRAYSKPFVEARILKLREVA